MPDKDKLLAAIDRFEESAYGSDSDSELESQRSAAIDAYLGKNTLPAPDGRSQVVDRSVYETIQWQLPSLCRVFANGDDVVEIIPVGPEDEEQAKQESQYLNYLILQKNPWFEVFRTAAHDALLSKAGYLYAFKDKRRFVEMEKYERQTPQSLALLLQDKALEIVDGEEYPDEEAEPQIDPMTGMPGPPPMLYNVQVRRTREENAFKIVALPPERCKIAEETPSWHLLDSPYFEYFEMTTISDLRAEGFDVEDDVADDDDTGSLESTSRNQYSEVDGDEEYIDPAMRRVKKRMIWIRHDYDEDGISEMQYVVRVGRTILHREECNRIPVAVLACDPMPHRHVGLSTADTALDIQTIKTSILRQGLDNLYLSNNPRTYANPAMVNLDDLMVSRPGGIVRGKGQFGVDLAPMVTPFVFDKAMMGLEYMDQVRENRTGVNRYFTGIDQNALNKTASGISQLTSMAAQRVEQIARTMALGIEQIGSILHEIVLKSGHQKQVVRLRGKWVDVDPASWKNRYDFRISVTYAAGNKDAQMAKLQLIAGYQAQALEAGVPVVTPDNVYQTAIELSKAADLSTPEKFWTEPSKIPPKQPPQPDPTVMAVEQLKAQVSTQTNTESTQQKERDSIRDFEIKKYQIDTDAQVKLELAAKEREKALEVEGFKAINGRDADERKFTFDLAKDGERKQLKDKSEKADQTESKSLEALTKIHDMISKHTRSAKRISKRGKDGRAEEVEAFDPETGDVLSRQMVVRGPDGRPVGIQ